MDQSEHPEHEVVETLDYDGTIAKLEEWKGRQVSVRATGPETDAALMHLSVEGTLGAVRQMEQPPGVGGVMVPIGERRLGYENCAHPSYLTMSRAAHGMTRLERMRPHLAHGIPDEVEFLSIDLGNDFNVQVSLLAHADREKSKQ